MKQYDELDILNTHKISLIVKSSDSILICRKDWNSHMYVIYKFSGENVQITLLDGSIKYGILRGSPTFHSIIIMVDQEIWIPLDKIKSIRLEQVI